MIEFTMYWVLIGFTLCLQHSYRFHLKNGAVLGHKSYLDAFEDTRLFYFTCVFLWIFALDFLVEVDDYNELDK